MGKLRDGVMDTVTVVTAVAALAVAGNALLGSGPRRSGPAFETKEIAEWETVVAEGRRLGPEDAILTVVEWGDYECPFCQRYEEVLRDLRERYPEEVAVVYRH